MKNSLIAFIFTIAMSILGMLTDQWIGLDGNFGLIVSVATMGSFLIYNLNSTR